MTENEKFYQLWNGVQIIIRRFENKKKDPIQTPLCALVKELEETAMLTLHDMQVTSHNFKFALKTALGEAPNTYLMNEDYKALLIEDYRQVLKETIGLDFEFTIKNDNQLIEA
ncbi:MAG: hypothetical protein SGJ02_07845 [bacterium]|nr:hypothetical protein [bacterium]